MNNSEKLLKMKEMVETAKHNVAECDGSLKSLHKRLNDESKCNDLKSADKRLTEMDKDLENKETLLADGTIQLESKYEWGLG